MTVGVHDLNLMFLSSHAGTELGRRELLTLCRQGFRYLRNENTPLWRWYSKLSTTDFDLARFSSILGQTDEEKIGAIHVLAALDRGLLSRNEVIGREQIIERWFAADSSSQLKTAALFYLAKCGDAADYPKAKSEYDSNNQSTFRAALECMISIVLRTGGPPSAQELLLSSQFESLDADLLEVVLKGFQQVTTAKLKGGIEHRNPEVRLRTLDILLERSQVDVSTAEALCRDRDARLRSRALRALESMGRSFSYSEITEVLTQRAEEGRFSVLRRRSVRGYDAQRRVTLERYLVDDLRQLSDTELTRRLDAPDSVRELEYFVRAEKYWNLYADRLRVDVDDRFSSHIERRTHRETDDESNSKPNMAESRRFIIEYTQRLHTRRGLDIICRKREPEDLTRVRTTLTEGYPGISIEDARYLARLGSWEDIALLSDAYIRPSSFPTATTVVGSEAKKEVVNAIIRLGRKKSIAELVALDLPDRILASAIEACSDTWFSGISIAALMKLLDHEAEDVRRHASIKFVRASSTKKVRDVLRRYISNRQKQYYNVIHWLDLGASLSREQVRKVVSTRWE